MSSKIVILGAGPTGLGAAYRLQELGHRNWDIYEKESYLGGLAASFVDDKGFTWDFGGHVVFSHYAYFDDLFEKLLERDYTEHQRESWIWLFNRRIPYPFQNNIRYLPRDKVLECLWGLIQAQKQIGNPRNFEEWILTNFGKGIAEIFMFPYNRKLWRFPLEGMDKSWIEERVSVINTETVLKNVILERDDKEWGPNRTFRFPLHGGTGGFFARFQPLIKDHLHLGQKVTAVDCKRKEVRFADGRIVGYDSLISTIPLDELVAILNPHEEQLIRAASELHYSGVCMVGMGIKKPSAPFRCWTYFPEDTVPFYRITNFSGYSPYNVPDAGHLSLMCEASYPASRSPEEERMVEETVEGLAQVQLLSRSEQDLIASRFVLRRDHAYPIPSLSRDAALKVLQSYLMRNAVFSRGRFGAWRYEIGNMDHSVMMGVEVVDRILEGQKERVWSL